MKKILNFFVALGMCITSYAQHTIDKDTSWTSLLQNSIGTNVKFDDQMNYYVNYSLYTSYESESNATRFLQKRNGNNDVLWQIPLRNKVVGFDYDSNPICVGHGYNELYAFKNYIYRFNSSNGQFMDSIQIFSDLYGGNVTSVKKYNGDFLFYGNALARFTSSFQPVFVFDTPNMAIIPREIYSTIKNDSLFFVVSGTNSSSLQFIKLNTGFYGTISTGVGANNFLDKSVIECNGSFIANGTTLDKLIKIDASVNTDLILNKRGFLLNTENIDEFLVLGQTSLARCNKYGTVINSIDLPSGFSLISSLDWNSKSFYYSQGFTYVFGKNNNHLSVLTYDLNLVLVNEYIDNGDPISGVEWQSFHSNNSGCFALVGKQYYGSKYNVKLLKFCTADASISEESENIFQIYPNPTSSTISIQFEHNNTVDNLRIYSISGELVKDIKIQQSNELLFTIEITNINPGIYFVKIGNHSKKLIIE